VSDQAAAGEVKSSTGALLLAFGLVSGMMNSATSPLLPMRRGALRYGAGIAAASASLARRIAAERCGSVISFSRVMMASISVSRCR